MGDRGEEQDGAKVTGPAAHSWRSQPSKTSTDQLREHLDWGRALGLLQKEGDLFDLLYQLPTSFQTQI